MPQHKRGPWSATEDQYLLHLVQVHGAHNWVRISSVIQTRSPKQCRERFHQNLKPTLNHDPITPEEGILIEQMVAEMGKRWAEIARRLRGRSDNAVKNWWNGGMNRRRRSNNNTTSQQRRVEHMEMPQQPQASMSMNNLPMPQHHHALPQYQQHPQQQHYFGHPMFNPHAMAHPPPQISVPSNGGPMFARNMMGEQPLPSPSSYSQISADGAPSLISDCSTASARSPLHGTSPIELPPLGAQQQQQNEQRRHSSAPMLGVPGQFGPNGEFHMPMQHHHQMKQQQQQQMLQGAFQQQQQQQQQFAHPAQYLPSQPRRDSPMQHQPFVPPQLQQQFQIPAQMMQRHDSKHMITPIPSTPVQLPGIQKSADDKFRAGLALDPELHVHSLSTPDGSPKDKMSLSNLTH